MTKTMGATLLLFVSGLSLASVGATYLYDPNIALRIYGVAIEGPMWAHIIKAAMGGPLTVIGLFLMTGAFRRAWYVPALWVQVVFLTAIVVGRVVSFIGDGIPRTVVAIFGVAELFMALGAAYYLRKQVPSEGEKHA